jgi:alpha-galactosidase
MSPRLRRVLVCLTFLGEVIQLGLLAQTQQPLGARGRTELSADSIRGIFIAARDASGGRPHVHAVLGYPSFVLRDGRRLVTHLISLMQTKGRSDADPSEYRVRTAAEAPGGMRLIADWKMKYHDKTGEVLSVLVELSNSGARAVEVVKATTVNLLTDARWFGADSMHSFWSFQGATYPDRPDWIFPLRPGFSRENFQGMNAADYGGGIPVVDLWTRFGGVAIGSLAPRPEQLALPVSVTDEIGVQVSIEERDFVNLPARGHITLQPFVVILHSMDFFSPLRTYYRMVTGSNAVNRRIPAMAYGSEWCAWGYERSCVPRQILATLPLVQKLGMQWVTIDDGYQNADGDWMPDPVKYPRGDQDMRSLVDSIHAHGFKAMLWWVPFEAHDSAYSAEHFPDRMKEFGMALQSRLAKNHADWFQLNADGSRTQVSWWNSYTLCPALPAVRSYYVSLVKRFVKDWGFDGFKIDGQNMNAVPPCYNPNHHHTSPLDAPHAVPEFFRDVYAEATSLSPEFAFYICPCGTNFSVYNLPYVTIPVASDPVNGWQVRYRAKVYKAMLGDTVPYCGDHVELTNHLWDEVLHELRVTGEADFSSTIGVGGVPATKFTAPGIAQPDSSLILDGSKEQRWKNWLDIYRRERLSSGEYRNFYDIAYDKPETHVVVRGDTVYFALYANGKFSGKIQLRGLLRSRYNITDYVQQRSMGSVVGPIGNMDVTFENALLLKAIPIKRHGQ